MMDSISAVFHKNIRIMDGIGKAIIATREGDYETTVLSVGEVSEDITFVADTIMKNREYFELVSVESVAEMLEGILQAKHDQDFILLADLLELQMESFICNVQNLIMNKEDLFLYEESVYHKQIDLLKAKLSNSVEFALDYTEELNPTALLEKGYRVEFTSCGLMTLVATDDQNIARYLHTNHKISQEAYILARSWIQSQGSTYCVYGMGLGYHVQQLAKLVPNARIEVYEADMSILKLCCAFSDIEELLVNPNITFIYDPKYEAWSHRMESLPNDTKACIHYPSYRRRNDHLI
jgi:hypothetical protein